MLNVGHAIKSRLPRFLRLALRMGQRFGVNVTPRHFYSDIPDLRHLERTDYWRHPNSMYGVQGAEIEPQVAFARACCEPYAEKLQSQRIHQDAITTNGEPGYGPIESLFLYCYVRSQKPRKIIQIGCGVSTAVLLNAVSDEPDYSPSIVCIEPYPTRFLIDAQKAGRIQLIQEQAQLVELSTLTDLDDNGLFFVDSSHTVHVGSEVVRIIDEVLPRLRCGQCVHFHDVTFPYDYSPHLLADSIFFWREATLLYAFLVNNQKFTIDASLSMLHDGAQEGTATHHWGLPTLHNASGTPGGGGTFSILDLSARDC